MTKQQEYNRRYYELHGERMREANRQRRAADPEKIREQWRGWSAKWRTTNPDKERERHQRWYLANRDRYRQYRHERRARERSAVTEAFSRVEIYERDKGRCVFCGERVGKKWHLAHLIALAAGGTHTRENVAVAHPRCNQQDGTGRLEVQLRLLGAA